jgi:hypothetical protein
MICEYVLILPGHGTFSPDGKVVTPGGETCSLCNAAIPDPDPEAKELQTRCYVHEAPEGKLKKRVPACHVCVDKMEVQYAQDVKTKRLVVYLADGQVGTFLGTPLGEAKIVGKTVRVR